MMTVSNFFSFVNSWLSDCSFAKVDDLRNVVFCLSFQTCQHRTPDGIINKQPLLHTIVTIANTARQWPQIVFHSSKTFQFLLYFINHVIIIHLYTGTPKIIAHLNCRHRCNCRLLFIEFPRIIKLNSISKSLFSVFDATTSSITTHHSGHTFSRSKVLPLYAYSHT